eukprot:Amastigsp_a842321_14.p3 type:complete len:124 gc:universal Amastigsp_a842321_14:812-441(-)
MTHTARRRSAWLRCLVRSRPASRRFSTSCSKRSLMSWTSSEGGSRQLLDFGSDATRVPRRLRCLCSTSRARTRKSVARTTRRSSARPRCSRWPSQTCSLSTCGTRTSGATPRRTTRFSRSSSR